MTIQELYERLSDKDFLDPSTGNLFSRAYMYLYDAEKEYEIREEIEDLKNRLIRPDIYRNILIVDLFKTFNDFLVSSQYGKHGSFLDFIEKQEQKDPDKVAETLKRQARGDNFLKYLNEKIETHFDSSGAYEVGYVMIHGLGAIFPYIRTSKFLSSFEKYYMDNQKYKLILFYPGTAEKIDVKLFGEMEDANPYRAIKLINE